MTGNKKSTISALDSRRWIILTASCLINLCIGSLYAWSVFATPLADKLNGLAGNTGNAVLTAANLAVVFTVANSIGPVTMISGGWINDKLGPRWVVFSGGILFGLGMIACGSARTIPFLLVAYGLGCGLGMGLVYGCTISNSVKFFPDKKGLIGGIATATYGLSSVIIPPAANAMISSLGISRTFYVLGAIMLAVIGLCSMFIERCPEGYAPKGWLPGTADKAKRMTGKKSVEETDHVAGAKSVTEAKRTAGQDKDWKQMISDPIFYVMILMLMCGAFSGLMITSQASPMAQKIAGMSAGTAAAAVSALALFNAAGRVIAGFLSDRLGSANVLLAAFILELAGLFFLLTAREGAVAGFMIGVAIMGICFGSLMGVYPGFTAAQFGAKNNSMNYGIMFIGFALAGFFGPTIAGKIISAYGSYEKAFYIAGILATAGIGLVIIYQKMQKKKTAG